MQLLKKRKENFQEEKIRRYQTNRHQYAPSIIERVKRAIIAITNRVKRLPVITGS